MADPTLGIATLRSRLDLSGLRTGLNQAKGETKKFALDAGTAIKGISSAFGAVVASRGVRSYISFLRGSAQLAQQADAANRLFQKSLGRTNQSLAEGAGLVDRLSDRFGVANSVIQSSATLLLRQGASLDDIERALTAAGASAAAAGFDISTAFDNVATAVATGRSELLETSGIVTNLGPVTQQYAKSIGKTVDELTDQEVIQARVNAIYSETRQEIEDVDEILQGLPRAQAEVTQQWRDFREDVGGVAREVILPLTRGLGTMLQYVNALPEPVKRVGIAMTGAAIGATALAAGIVAIRTALAGFSALGLLSFGPAGWVVLGAVAVAGLVAVLAGGGKDTLEGAVNKAKTAIGSAGDKESVAGALEGLSKNLRGDAKDAVLEYAKEVRTATGDLEELRKKALEVANAPILAKIGALQAENQNLAGQIGTAATASGDIAAEVIARVQEQLARTGLVGIQLEFNPETRGLRAKAGSTPPVLTPQQAEIIAAGSRDVQAALGSDLVARIQENNKKIEHLRAMLTVAPTGTTPSGLNGGVGSGGGGITAVADVQAQVQRAVAARQAADLALGGDPYRIPLQRRLEFEARQRAEDEAEARERNYQQVVKPAMERIAEERAQREAELGGAAFPPSTNALRGFLAGRRSSREEARADRLAERSRSASQGVIDAQLQFQQIMSGNLVALEAYGGFFNRDRARMESESEQLAEAARVNYRVQRESFTTRLVVRDRNAEVARQLQLRAERLERENARDARVAQQRITASQAVIDAQLDFQASMKLSGVLMPEQRRFNDAQSGFVNRDLARGDGGLQEAAAIFQERERQRQQEQAAADRFSETVVSAGFAMGDAAVNAIKDGDIPSLIRAGLSGAGSILGGANLGSIPFLGGSIGVGGLIAGGIGLLGTLIGGLAGGQNDADRAAEQSRRLSSAPAININFTVNQSNQYNGAPSDPVNEQAFARQADRLFESLYRRHLGPRLEKIERRVGIAGSPA